MLSKKHKQIANFLIETEKFKLIERVACLSNKKRRENDAEHSWHLAIMIMVLKNDLQIKFNENRAIKIALVHDLAEIYTGDDFVRSKKAKKIKNANETKAVKKLFSILPSNIAKEFYSYWNEYLEGKTIESKIVKALDKICYPLQYSISGKIVWPHEEDSAQERRAYGMPYLKFNKNLIKIYDHFLAEIEKNKK